MTARDDILAAIRAARPLHDAPAPPPPAHRRSLGLAQDALATLLTARLEDYGVAVTRILEPAAIPSAVMARCRHRGMARMIVPSALPMTWRPPGAIEDKEQPIAALDEAEGALTGCRLAIAETGTIILDGGPLSGRRALTLLPDYHLCIVTADQVVGLLPEAMDVLAHSLLSGPVTLVSGPSATADIELDRVQGVHGPRTLDVILVG